MTKNPIIWFQYLCWCIQFWMSNHKPYYPDWLRFWLRKRYPDSQYCKKWQVEFYKKNDPRGVTILKPWPWYVGDHCFGPFLKPWGKVVSFFRGFTGGRSHRCEFTDPEHGALYGHNKGAFMNRLFEKFIERI
jgi:hypothetical protein